MEKISWIISLIVFCVLFYKDHKKKEIGLFSPLTFFFGLMVGLAAFILYRDFMEMNPMEAAGLSFGWASISGYFFYYFFNKISTEE